MAGILKGRGALAKQTKKMQEARKQEAKQSGGLTGGRSGNNIAATLARIKLTTQQYLSKYIDQYLLLRTEDEVISYFDKVISAGIAAIDTETTGLDPWTCKVVGLCLYVKGEKPCYIPVGHVGHVTQQLLPGQVSMDFLKSQLERCKGVKWIYHNAKFDIKMIIHSFGLKLDCYWDTFIAAMLLNENEPHGLKHLHLKYCNSQDTEPLTISTLFDGLNFALIPIESAYLYAAGDAIKTYELYEFQKKHLDSPALAGPRWIMDNIELPVLPVIIDMEEQGVHVDKEYCKVLHDKYSKKLEDAEEACYKCLDKYREEIALYMRTTPNHKLSTPISLNSPTQIAILLYDILKLQPKTKSRNGSARGTGEEVLASIDHEFPKLLLEFRAQAKLISTYVDKLPNVVNPQTGNIHPTFHQMGAATGRMSSSDPNLQNIPSHNKDIRKMFTAQPGYYLVSGDYSQQEVRVLAHICGDENMRQAYADNLDIYSWIGSMVYKVPYEECKEFYPDGTTNTEGKKRRTSMKSVVLGLMYSRGVQGIAEQLHMTVKEAQEITDAFYDAFPRIKQCIEESHESARTRGYVETVKGRKRRLPEMQLPPYEFKIQDSSKLVTFDALDFDSIDEPTIPIERKNYYAARMDKAYGFSQKQKIKEEALAEGIEIIDNGGKIADASRQCLNSRVQGQLDGDGPLYIEPYYSRVCA